MDFMKAFDKVPHKRLLRKLRIYGLSEQIIKWVEDFLSDRSQKVSVNNSESRDRPVTSGIPQGSVLGPILFVIYINDVPECVNASTYIFADDTKIYKEISCEDVVSGLQADLDQLQKWSDTWLLKFHSNKYKVMTVSNKTKLENKSSYHLYNNEGEEVELEMSEGEKDI